MKKKELVRIISGILNDNGFAESVHEWIKDMPESIILCGVQKSNYSNQYYINFGVYFKEDSSRSNPVESDCHVRVRLSEKLSEDCRGIDDALNLDVVLADSERVDIILKSTKFAIAYIDECSSVAGMHSLQLRGKLPNAIMLFAKRLLDRYRDSR
jgi:hypothetical protein